MPYPETANLPFNRSSLPSGFILHPEPKPFSGGDARWVIIIKGQKLLMQNGPKGLELPYGEMPDIIDSSKNPILFATWDGLPVCAGHAADNPAIPDNMTEEPFNAFQERIPVDIMTVAGLGKQLLHAAAMTRFCPACGGRPVQIEKSQGKRCPECGHEVYPPIHPCSIVLIKRGDQLLLIRKPEWPVGRYSLVAGFMDVGESLEECTIREAMEETGVTIKNVRYVTSQAWPFPSQLMVGFTADYAYGDIKVDGEEIDDARWFTIGSLPSLPASRSIARFLIDSFS